MATDKATSCIIGPAEISFPALFEPKAIEGSTSLKYSVTIKIPKTAEGKEMLKPLQKAIAAAIAEGKDKKFGGKDWKQIPKFIYPIYDGDKDKDLDKYPDYKGCWFINCSSETPPGVVDKKRKPILDKEEIYSGAICYISVNCFAYKNKSVGIGVGLNNVLKFKDGERLSGKPSAQQDFADLEIDEVSDLDLPFDGDEEIEFEID